MIDADVSSTTPEAEVAIDRPRRAWLRIRLAQEAVTNEAVTNEPQVPPGSGHPSIYAALHDLILTVAMLSRPVVTALAVVALTGALHRPLAGWSWLSVVLVGLLVAESSWITQRLGRMRAPARAAELVLDVAVATAVLGDTWWTVGGVGRMAAVALGAHAAALVGLAGWSPLRTSGLVAPLVAGSVGCVLGRAEDSAILAFAAGGAVAAVAALHHGLRRATDRLAAAIDADRELAAEEARRDEFQRHRLLLHDHASILAMLAGSDLPPHLHTLARKQAQIAANTVKAFIDEPDHPSRAPAASLEMIVHDVVQDFADLPIVAVTSLASTERIRADQVPAVSAALRTVLHNTRNHAAARHVVVHADHPVGTDTWELTVRDDGRGFDVATTARSFGLRVQVVEQLAAVGVHTEIRSAPGVGTTVVMSHARPSSPASPVGTRTV